MRPNPKNTVTHFAPKCAKRRRSRRAICGHRATPAARTVHANQVTCGKCKRSPEFKAACHEYAAKSAEARKAGYPRVVTTYKGDGDHIKITAFDDPQNEPLDEIAKITTERGKNYGKPIEHFNTSQAMFEEWEDRAHASGTFCCMDIEKQRAVKHGVRFIIDKCVRAAENPMHKDNWDDIEGYARCIKDALELNDE